jgi:FAD:protein FMN transferase
VKRFLVTCLCAAGLLVGCRTAPEGGALSRYEFAEPHMGTLWRITLYAPDQLAASNAVRSAFARVAALDQCMTDYEAESELMRLSKAPPGVPVPVSDGLFRVLQKSQELAGASGGAFDVTVGPVVQLWRRARRQRELPDPGRLAAARHAVGFTNLRLDPRHRTATLLAGSMRLDLGGIAKGYGADEALRVLRGMGLSRALVAASGDLAIGDPPPGQAGWRVGIGVPRLGTTNLADALVLRRVGVSTSGDVEQFVELAGKHYSHIVDPRTGQALTNRIQATIIANCTTRSDALATTVCVLGVKKGLELIEATSRAAALVIVAAEGTNYLTWKSRRFEGFEKRP